MRDSGEGSLFKTGQAGRMISRERLRENRTPGAILLNMLIAAVSLSVNGFGIYLTIQANIGAAPWDVLNLGLSKSVGRIPIGLVSVAILSAATLTGWLLGGPVGIGTVICAFCAGPIMQLAFHTVRFDATGIRHQRLTESFSVFLHRADSN